MDLKIVSGVLVTRGHREGRVVVDLARNEIYEPEGDLESSDLRQERIVAPEGMEDWYFDVNPCFNVSVREFSVRDVDKFPFGSKPSVTTISSFNIDTRVNQTRLTINWSGREIEEISYLVMGTVLEP